MRHYDIRVLGDDGKTALILSEYRTNDHAAVRTAQRIAHGRKFEIWRGMECVYGLDATPVPKPPTPNRPAA